MLITLVMMFKFIPDVFIPVILSCDSFNGFLDYCMEYIFSEINIVTLSASQYIFFVFTHNTISTIRDLGAPDTFIRNLGAPHTFIRNLGASDTFIRNLGASDTFTRNLGSLTLLPEIWAPLKPLPEI